MITSLMDSISDLTKRGNLLPDLQRQTIQDHLGTPRMIIDQAGTLAAVKRHDYLPFGEELLANMGGRSRRLVTPVVMV